MTTNNKPLLFTKKDYLSNSPIFTNVVDCPTPYNSSCTLSDLHLHDFIEFSVVVSGSGIHRIWNKTYECKKGDVFILNTGVPHSYFGNAGGDFPTVLNVLFDEKLLAHNKNKSFCFGIFEKDPMIAYIRLSLDQLKKVCSICDTIKEELINKDVFWQENSVAYLKNLLITLSRLTSKEKELQPHTQKQSALVSRAVRLTLENYYKQDFTLDCLAKTLFVSKSHLSKLLYKECGEHFADYVKNLRIKRSATLLSNTNLSNSQIIEDCGFKDIPTFYKNFKKVYGVTPKQYRGLHND